MLDPGAHEGRTPREPPTVLVVEPDPKVRDECLRVLAPDHQVRLFATSGELLAALDGALEGGPVGAAILSDQLQNPGLTEVVSRLRDLGETSSASLIVTHQAHASAELDSLTAQGSVFYFLRLPFRSPALLQVVRRGVEACRLQRENAQLREQLDRINERLARENRFLRTRVAWAGELEGLLGQSAALQSALSELERVRVTDTTVHLYGETGTGKEVTARALHHGGPRSRQPFLAVNCAGMPESLLQSTLFGHRRGSFTGADRDHAGLFAEAHGGTLFLDEVAELTPAVQAALLRVLQEGEVTPVGGTQPTQVDVRVISATHADLRARVAEGRFREDLYFRLVVVAVRIPPLRERRADIPLLANHFLSMHCQRLGRRPSTLTEEAMRVLTAYDWPGNVRELEHELERVVVLSDEDAPLGPELLSAHLARGNSSPEDVEGLLIPEGLPYDDAVDHLMRQLIQTALTASGGGIGSAAARLGLERSRLGKLRRRLLPEGGP